MCIINGCDCRHVTKKGFTQTYGWLAEYAVFAKMPKQRTPYIYMYITNGCVTLLCMMILQSELRRRLVDNRDWCTKQRAPIGLLHCARKYSALYISRALVYASYELWFCATCVWMLNECHESIKSNPCFYQCLINDVLLGVKQHKWAFRTLKTQH